MILLSLPKAEHAARFEDMIAEYREHGEVGIYTGFYDVAWQGFDAYRAMLEKLSRGGWPFAEVVPGDTLFIMDGEEIVGEVYLRFAVAGPLHKDGGNLGYQIRPRARNKGYATAGLRLALERLKQRCQNRRRAA